MANKIDLSGGFHRLQPHGISATKNTLYAHAKTYANRSLREGDDTLIAADVGVIALQTNEKSLWLLTAAGPPPTWIEIPVTYAAPTFSSFEIEDLGPPLQVGETIDPGQTFIWSTTNPGSIEEDSIDILEVRGGELEDLIIAAGLEDDGSEETTYPDEAIDPGVATSMTYRIRATTTRGATITRDFVVPWYWLRRFGESTDTTLYEAGVLALRARTVTAGFAGTYVFLATGYKYLCYAAVLGQATTFKDSSTNLDVPFESPALVSIDNAYGVRTNYWVHRSTNIIGAAINIVVS